MTTAEDTRYAATLAWIEQLVASDPHLSATRHEYFTLAGQLWVRVEGSYHEADAWHHAVGGHALSSYVDGRGVWRKMILGIRVNVEVVHDPRKLLDDDTDRRLAALARATGGKPCANEHGGIGTALTFLVTLTGLFLWGWTHSSRSPNGATLLAVAILGIAVLVPTVFIRWWREVDRRSARYTATMQPRIEQDTSGEHYQDGA